MKKFLTMSSVILLAMRKVVFERREEKWFVGTTHHGIYVTIENFTLMNKEKKSMNLDEMMTESIYTIVKH